MICSNAFAYDLKSYPEVDHKTGKTLNLVFCPLNYQNKDDAAKDREMLIQRLKKTRPFNESNSFKACYVTLSEKEEADVFKPVAAFPPLRVRNEFLEFISTGLKSRYKLVIIDANGSISCAELSSVDKTSLIILGRLYYKEENSFAKGFLHELGHSLGLKDEYGEGNQFCEPGKPNCARDRKEAEAWWGDLVGKDERVNYISGCCGNKDYIRPTIASFMNDPDKAEDFGPVNERYLGQELSKQENLWKK